MAFFVVLGAAWVLGTFAVRRLTPGVSAESVTVRLYVGLSIAAVISLAFGSVSLRAAQCALYAIAAAGLGYELLFRGQPTVPRREALAAWRPVGRFDRVCLAVLACAGGLSLIAALAPVTAWDAAVAHIALPKEYARQGYIGFTEGNDYCGYPHFLHSLFAYAYFESGEVGVTLLGAFFGLLGCAALFALGSRVHGRRCGLIAAAAFATAPIYIDQAGGASLDVAFAGITVAALTAAIAWYEEENPAWLWVAAFLAGSSCGIRHTGLMVCALLAVGVLVAERPVGFRLAALFCVVAFLGALPWLTRSALLTSNPFYPFFSAALSSARLPAEEVAAVGVHSSLKGTGLKDLVLFPWNVILWPRQYDGWQKSPGPLVLFLGLPGILIGGKRVRALAAFSLAGIVCLFYFRQSARYLLPFFAPMMVVAGMAACTLAQQAEHAVRAFVPPTARPRGDRFQMALRHAARWTRVALCRLPARALLHGLFPALALTFAFGLLVETAAIHFKIPVVLGMETPTAYLARRVERYEAFTWVNEHLPPASVVLTLDPRSYYIDRTTYQNYEALKLITDRPLAEQLAWLRQRGITHLFFPRSYLEKAHGLTELGVTPMLLRWTENPRYFSRLVALDLESPRDHSPERVEIYALHY